MRFSRRNKKNNTVFESQESSEESTEFGSQKVANNLGGTHFAAGNFLRHIFPSKGEKKKKLSSIKILLSVRGKDVPKSDEP